MKKYVFLFTGLACVIGSSFITNCYAMLSLILIGWMICIAAVVDFMVD